MKRLTLVRHAQADSELPDQSDWERPLTRRGLNDAAEMARRLKSQRLKPDLILCSSALRTRQTAEAFTKCFGLSSDQVVFESELYLADTKHLLECVRAADDVHHLMVIAHNPGISEFAQSIAKDYEVDGMTTCAVFTAEFDIKQWKELTNESGVNASLDYPQRSA
ncbi:MAG: histidine phosphatase family protein [Steroidobacter sp.]